MNTTSNLNAWVKLLRSFDNTSDGYSARKLSAFVGVATAIYITHQHVNESNLEEILNTWLIFVGFMLGVVTVEQFLRFKEGGKSAPPPATTKTESEVIQ